MASAPNRDGYYEDFLKNRVYVAVRIRLDLGQEQLDLSDAELRKLAAAGGLMAKVALQDHGVSVGEFDRMLDAIQSKWHTTRHAAAFVAEVAVSDVSAELDYLRLSREFCELTTPAERAQFLDVLFEVADGDGFVSREEIKVIDRIATTLMLSNERLTEAKLKIPRDRFAA